ncbi:hypothetical protein V8B97DRAFT_1944585 [Scleroderma yunnanense]
MTSPQDIYARVLTRAEPRRGYPLWFPEPNNNLPEEYHIEGVQIGDVGVVTGRGSFDVFFNICRPEDHALNRRYGVPEGFKQIFLQDHEIESYVPGDHRGRVVAAQSMKQKNLTFGAALGTSAVEAVQGNLGIEFTSSSKEGAPLVLPEGADEYALLNHRLFVNEAKRSGKSWYEFAINRLGRMTISTNSLYLITGCHKTSSWSLAAFHQPGGTANFNAQFTAGAIVDGNISAAYSWQMTTAVPWRVGPVPYLNEVKNQTAFIRGYKIVIRESILARILGDVDVSYGLPNTAMHKVQSTQHIRPSGGSSEHCHTGNTSLPGGAVGHLNLEISAETGERSQGEGLASVPDVCLCAMPPMEKIYHPSDLLIECTLHKDESPCDVFIIHDHVWGDAFHELLQGQDSPKDDMEVIPSILKKYSVMISEGMAYLRSRDVPSGSHLQQAGSSISKPMSSGNIYGKAVQVDDPMDNSFFEMASPSISPLALHYQGSAPEHVVGNVQEIVDQISVPVDEQNKVSNCPSTVCLWESMDGMPCFEPINYDDGVKHFKTMHAIKNLSRNMPVLCKWLNCRQVVARHNFTRHVREAHLNHGRGTGHASKN